MNSQNYLIIGLLFLLLAKTAELTFLEIGFLILSIIYMTTAVVASIRGK